MPGLLRAVLAGLAVLVRHGRERGEAPGSAGSSPRGAGGGGGGGGGVASACDGGSSVCAQFQSGQTFVTWTDLDTGAAGNNWRYWVYRSTSPITSGNYASATLIASYVLNNSGQLFGGNPDTSGAAFTQANRQSAAQPMAKLVRSGDGAVGLYRVTGLHRAGDPERLLRRRRQGVGRVLTGGGRHLYRLGRADRRERRHPDADQIRRQHRGRFTARSQPRPARRWCSRRTPRRALAAAATRQHSTAIIGRGGCRRMQGWQDGRQTAMDVLQDTNARRTPLPRPRHRGLVCATRSGSRSAPAAWRRCGIGLGSQPRRRDREPALPDHRERRFPGC